MVMDSVLTHLNFMSCRQGILCLLSDTSSFNAYCLLQRVMLYSGMTTLLGKKKNNGGIATFVQDSLYSFQIRLQIIIQAVAVQTYLISHTLTICSLYLPLHILVTLVDL